MYCVDNSECPFIYSETGTMTYDIQTPKVLAIITASKKDESSQRLTVQILKNGNVIESNSTDAPKGAATCKYNTI